MEGERKVYSLIPELPDLLVLIVFVSYHARMHTAVNNPVIDLDEDELREQATSLGMPVSAALRDSSFAQVAPEGLVIPEPGEGGSQGSGATSVFFSLTLLTLALVAGVFMM